MLRQLKDRWRKRNQREVPSILGWELKRGVEEDYDAQLRSCIGAMNECLSETSDVVLAIGGKERSLSYITICKRGTVRPSLRFYPHTGTVIEMTSAQDNTSHNVHTRNTAEQKLAEYGLAHFVDSPFFSDETTAAKLYKDFNVSS